MSRLSEILGVKEGQEFRYAETDMIYKVKEEYVYYKKGEIWTILIGMRIYLMIENPDKIRPIRRLTEQQITAIKGRIAEGTPWAARSQEQIYFYENKPLLVNDDDCSSYFRTADFDGFGGNSDFYDFITDDNSPVYLPELVEGSEEE